MNRLRRKTCRTCKVEKYLRQFYKHPTYADGYMNDCRDCKRAYSRDMHWLKRDQILVRQKHHYYANWARERAKRRAYQQSPRGREVHRESCRVYVRLKRMEARA